MQYQSLRHQRLMDESEQALLDTAEASSGRESRIAKQILNDPKIHRLWESRHAELVLPVAEHNRRVPQVIALRGIEVRLAHRRALIDHIRNNHVIGRARDRLFSIFYGPREVRDAILAEHRQYTLAVSSRISADHLINVMCDPISNRLLEEYESIFAEYFDLYCFVVSCEDSVCADAAKLLMLDARRRAKDARLRIFLEQPDKRFSNFERQALLARSGRYPMLEYMVG